MKYIFILFVSTIIVFTFYSCGGKEKTEAEVTEEQLDEELESAGIEEDEYVEGNLTKMKKTVENMAGGLGTIVVEPDATLPVSKDDARGVTYCDNVATITSNITGATTSRQFHKTDFDQFLTDELRSKGILQSVMFDEKTSGGNLKLEATVAIPHSEEGVTIKIYLTPTGDVSMEKENIDEYYEDVEGD